MWKRKSIFFQDFSSRATFKCYVVMDGYQPYRIYEQVDNSDKGLCFQPESLAKRGGGDATLRQGCFSRVARARGDD
jgi:hypothetical protein